MTDHGHAYRTDAKWGGLTFVYALLLWGALLGTFLVVGHLLARQMIASHQAEAQAEGGH